MPIGIAALGLGALGLAKGLIDTRATLNRLEEQEDNALQQARITRRLGKMELRLFNRQAEANRGRIPAAAAFAGVDVNAGSALDVLMEQARNDATAAHQIRVSRELQAFGFEQQADSFSRERDAKKIQRPFDIIGNALGGFAGGNPFTGGVV
jgi:hypothetical protein